jgi:hypothetical protein
MTSSDCPLAIQTAAPPVVPPRRPIVGIAMPDDDFGERLARLDDLARALEASHAATQAALRALRERLEG